MFERCHSVSSMNDCVNFRVFLQLNNESRLSTFILLRFHVVNELIFDSRRINFIFSCQYKKFNEFRNPHKHVLLERV